ncbi:hypothetical protein, partial [Shewanella baltica]|uniref:hypothetical protein n=1 Tax=Shewanella baltica TaxID=62322 RepID=UPI001C12AE57
EAVEIALAGSNQNTTRLSSGATSMLLNSWGSVRLRGKSVSLRSAYFSLWNAVKKQCKKTPIIFQKWDF